MTLSMKSILLSGLLGLLALGAVTGWTRNPGQATATRQLGTIDQPAYRLAGATYTEDCVGVYATRNCPGQGGSYAPQGEAARISRAAYQQQSVSARPLPYVGARPAHRRSWKKSTAIVAGTSGFGAAIGALAGGGRGAAIGALTGGGAGFLYDRMTHNRAQH